MPRAGFYNDNEYRQYPFVFRSAYSAADLPTELIVDCGFIMGLDSEFNPTTDIVYLHSITKTAAKLQFTFKTTAAGAVNKPIVFERDLTPDEWAYEHADSAPASNTGLTDAIFCATEPVWSGFLVTGRIAEFAASAPNNTTYTFNQERAVEPSRIQSLVKAYLRSVNVGNYARTVIQPCGSSSSSGATRPVIVNAACVKGNIQLRAGFNCEITQDSDLNELRIAVSKDANTTGLDAAEFCENGSEIKLYPGEIPPVGSKFLSGGPACDEVITAINGLPAPDVKIVGGAGIQVVPDLTQQHTLLIKRVENLLSQTC
jgi:hypothetical protein